MVKLTFYGGVDEVGGNKILLEDKKTRLFFDFGQSFSFGSDYFTGWLMPRGVNGVGDYFAFDLLPRIKGLYGKEMLAGTDLAYRKPRVDAVFISHAHSDHVGHLEFLDPEIPVYLGFGTKLFMDAMKETSVFCYGEHPCNLFRTGDKIRVGSVTVEPVHVDHSIPAAYGFIISTSGGCVVYTGDLRRHGPRKDLTEEFLERARAAEPSALITEGTRMALHDSRQNFSEPQVRKESDRVVASTEKAVFTMRASRDIDRFNSFYHVARKNGRKLVVTPKTAHLLTKLQNDEHLKLPDPKKDDCIAVYYKRKKSGGFDESDYYVWEREFMDKKVTHEYIRRHQRGVIMDLDFTQFAELIDIKPRPGSHFIHSMSEPFSEEDLEDQVMHNWIDHFKMQFHQLHASGHMTRNQLIEMVNFIRPREAFAVHTENQQLFKQHCDCMQTIEYGKEYMLK